MIWLTLLPISWAAQLLAVLLSPLSALLIRDDGTLPKWLAWSGTTDNPNWGDEGHEKRWGYAHSFMQVVAWICRNRAYSFHWDGRLGACINSPVRVYGDPWIKNRQGARAGWYFCLASGYWNFKLIYHLFGDTAIMLEFGWKLQEFAQGKTEGRAQYVFSPRLTAFYP